MFAVVALTAVVAAAVPTVLGVVVALVFAPNPTVVGVGVAVAAVVGAWLPSNENCGETWVCPVVMGAVGPPGVDVMFWGERG